MSTSLFAQGLDLMLYGMGTVFVFLALLVVGTTWMSALINKYLPEPIVGESSPVKPVAGAAASVDPKTVAIIQEAINAHRSAAK